MRGDLFSMKRNLLTRETAARCSGGALLRPSLSVLQYRVSTYLLLA